MQTEVKRPNAAVSGAAPAPEAKQAKPDGAPAGVSINPLTGAPYSRRFFELLQKRRSLPAWEAREDWLQVVKACQVVILSGETGSGKTTQVPQIMLDAGYHVQNGQFRCLASAQPHPLASMGAAQRVSEELDVPLGTFVGYVVPFEDKTSEQTLLRFMTDEVLLQQLMADPLLQRYSVVMLDEVHDRSLATDLLIGLLKSTLQRRPELKLVLLSATPDLSNMHNYFHQAPIISMPARTHPVDVFHLIEPEKDYLQASIKSVLQIHCTEPDGDILVFLTSEEELEVASNRLLKEAKEPENAEKGDLIVVCLHSGALLESLMRLNNTAQSKSRRVILSTHISETSLPLDSVSFVVDSGFVRQKLYNPRTRLETPLVVPITRTSSLRRAACASRKGPGKCWRMYAEASLNAEMREQVQPEILRSNLLTSVLALKRLGVEDIVHFDYLDPPPPEALMRAFQALNYLGCMDDEGDLTECGIQVAKFPVDPQIAKMLLESATHKCSNEALSIAAMLCLPSVFVKPRERSMIKAAEDAKKRFTHLDGDHLTLLNVFHAFKQNVQDGVGPGRFCLDNCLNLRCMMSAEGIRDQLRAVLEQLGIPLMNTNFQDPAYYPNIRRCLLSGFFMQVAHDNGSKEKTGQYVTVRERQDAVIHPSSTLQQKPEWLVYHEFTRTSKHYLRTVTQVKGEWLLELAPKYFEPRKFPECETRTQLEAMINRVPA